MFECLQFVHTVDDYAARIADAQSNATFELGTHVFKPSSAAVHWIQGTFNGIQYSTAQTEGGTTRCGSCYILISAALCGV